MNRTLFIVLSTISLLSACQVGPAGMSLNLGLGSSIGNHVGIGTSVNIPVRFNQHANNPSSGLNIIEEQIIAYFDAQGNVSNQAVKGGFYRQLISKRNDYEYLVQDFYEDGGKKRTDPMILPRQALFEFRAHPTDGTLTVYAYNGNVMQQQVYRNNQLISAQY